MQDETRHTQTEPPVVAEITISEEVKKGLFSNNVFVSHTPEEFILDFLALGPQGGSVVSRVFLVPSHTKRLIEALAENLRKYEETFGEVPREIQPK